MFRRLNLKKKNDVELIPNVRFNDERTYNFCFDGVEKFKTVAVGTHGCIKNKIDKDIESLSFNFNCFFGGVFNMCCLICYFFTYFKLFKDT